MFFNFHHATKDYSAKGVRAFTFVEFIVIISIFGIMASVALFNFQGFRSSVALNNLVYDIALEIKTAQTLGVSAPGSDVNNAAQVVSMQFDHDGSQFVNAFTTYREIDSQGLGEFSPTDDVVLRQASLRGGTIQSISWCPPGLNQTCTPFTEDVYISFRRPNPEPVVTAVGCNGVVPTGYVYEKCENGNAQIAIVAEGNSGNIQYVYVEQTGQIRVADQ